MQTLLFALFASAMIALSVLATRTDALLAWPGYAILGLTGILALARGRARLLSSPSDLCLLTVFLAGAYLVIRATVSPVTYIARFDLVLVLCCFTAYVLCVGVFSHRRWRTLTFWLLLLIGLVNVGFVARQVIWEDWGAHILPWYARSYGAGRAGGLFNNPNHLAAFLLPCVFFPLCVALLGRGGPVKRIALLFLAAAFGLCTLLTASRGGGIALIVGSFAFMVLGLMVVRRLHPYQFKKVVIGFGVLALVGVLGASLIVPQIHAGRGYKLENITSASGLRTGLWRAASSQAAEAPIFGTGARTFEYKSRLHRPESIRPHNNDALFAHNEYFQALGDYGFVGFGLIAAAFGIHFANGWSHLARTGKAKAEAGKVGSSDTAALVVGAIVSLLALLAHAVFEFHLHVPAVALIAAFCLAILANPGWDGRGSPLIRIPHLRTAMRVFACLAGMTLLFYTFTVGRADYYVERSRFIPADRNFGIDQLLWINKAKEIDPDNFEAFFLGGHARLAMLNPALPSKTLRHSAERALEDFERARELYPDQIFVLEWVGHTLDVLGRHDEAGQAFLHAIEIAPRHLPPRVAYGKHLHRLGRFDEAIEVYISCRKTNAYATHTNVYIDPFIKEALAAQNASEERERAQELQFNLGAAPAADPNSGSNPELHRAMFASGHGGPLRFESPSSVPEMIAIFRQQLIENAWSIDDLDVSELRTRIVATRDGRQALVVVAGYNGQTQVMLNTRVVTDLAKE